VVLADNSSGLVFRSSLAKGFNPEDAEVSLRLTEESFLGLQDLTGPTEGFT